MYPQPPCVQLLNELAGPTEKLSTLLPLVRVLDDAATPRGQLITVLYIVKDYYEEVTERLELHAKFARPGIPRETFQAIRQALNAHGITVADVNYEVQCMREVCGAMWSWGDSAQRSDADAHRAL